VVLGWPSARMVALGGRVRARRQHDQDACPCGARAGRGRVRVQRVIVWVED